MFRTVYPNKVFDYMAAGRPTVLAIDGVIREVIEAAGRGHLCATGRRASLGRGDASISARSRLGKSNRVRPLGGTSASTLSGPIRRQPLTPCCNNWSHAPRRSWYTGVFKRAIDCVVAATAGVLLSPLILVVFGLVRWKLGSPALFRQPRAGLHGRPFTLYKFRTMRDAVDRDGQPLPDDAAADPLGPATAVVESG